MASAVSGVADLRVLQPRSSDIYRQFRFVDQRESPSKTPWARQSVWHIMQEDWRLLLVTTLLCYATMELSLQFWEAQREPVQMAEPHCKETQNDRVQSCESGEGF